MPSVTCRIEHEDVVALFAVVGKPGDLEAAHRDPRPFVGPRHGGVVDVVAAVGDLHCERERRPLSEARAARSSWR
jgi:hypothetical protein